MPFIFYGFLFAALVADILTKALAVLSLAPGVSVSLVPYLISWNLTTNDGVAFGINIPAKNIVTVLLIIGLFVWWRAVEIRKRRGWADAAFGMMLGGALGNGFERLAYGSVTDFIDLNLFVCNVGDIALTAGVVLLASHDWMVSRWRAWFPVIPNTPPQETTLPIPENTTPPDSSVDETSPSSRAL